MTDMKNLARTMGRNLRRIRHERGMTLEEVSLLSGVSYVTVFRMETAESSSKISTWLSVCDALNIQLLELLREDG